MTRKYIEKKLEIEFLAWLDSIKDEKVKNLCATNSIITGGSIVSLLLNEKVHDYDIYFVNKETVKAVAEYYVNLWNEKVSNESIKYSKAFVLDGNDVESWKSGEVSLDSIAPGYSMQSVTSHMITNCEKSRIKIIIPSKGVAGIDNIAGDDEDNINNEVIKSRINDNIENILDDADSISEDCLESKLKEEDRYIPIFLTSNAITLSNHIQLVIRFYGEPSEIHANYDYVHCTNYWLSKDSKLYLNQEALESILAKQLIYRGSKYPICSVFRSRKFIKRGWFINAGQYLKMCLQISELDLKDPAVLEDQLIGVDTAYFMVLIYSLTQKMLKNPAFEITNAYIISIIDKIF